MILLKILTTRLAALFRRRPLGEQLNDEVCAHFEILIEDNVRPGACRLKRLDTRRYAALAG
ncbi:MAG TPA: hypothetical protein VG206_19385 [Terriglobia bacterium]|nr:hypothetical protein [Terriglobia bacterium]